jgi:hypothetical protein
MFVSNEFFNFQGAFTKYFLVLKSFSIRQSKELLFLSGINVDSEIDYLSIVGISGTRNICITIKIIGNIIVLHVVTLYMV